VKGEGIVEGEGEDGINQKKQGKYEEEKRDVDAQVHI